MTPAEREAFVDIVAHRNVVRSVQAILQQSRTLRDLERDGRVFLIAVMYNLATGEIEFLNDYGNDLTGR